MKMGTNSLISEKIMDQKLVTPWLFTLTLKFHINCIDGYWLVKHINRGNYNAFCWSAYCSKNHKLKITQLFVFCYIAIFNKSLSTIKSCIKTNRAAIYTRFILVLQEFWLTNFRNIRKMIVRITSSIVSVFLLSDLVNCCKYQKLFCSSILFLTNEDQL